MKLGMRALLVYGCLIALGTVAVTAYPALAGEFGTDLWEGTDWRTRFTESERRAGELAREEQETVRRTAVRTETVSDLIAGRIRIGEAVERFVELNRAAPATRQRVRERYAGDTDEERAGWQLVGHLQSRRSPRALALADEVAAGLPTR
jgi:hypothetical protein